MRKQEAAITARINKWFARIVPQSSPWEVKHTRGEKTFKMRELKEHQRNFLLAATTAHGCTWKIPDLGNGYAPFDVLHYKNTPAYVIVAFPSSVAVFEIRDLIAWDKPTISEAEAFDLSLWLCQRASLPK